MDILVTSLKFHKISIIGMQWNLTFPVKYFNNKIIALLMFSLQYSVTS